MRPLESGVASGAAGWMDVWPSAEIAIRRSVKGRLPPGLEPQDISQQVFVHLLRAGRHAPPPDRLTFWGVAVARRVLADLYRRKSIRLEDLATNPVVDIEAIVMARLRCEAAAEAYAALSPADRQALADPQEGSGPAPNKTKLRRSRARRALRKRAERLVGGGLILPRWGWLAGATGTAAVIVPLCLGVGSPTVDTSPDMRHRTPVGAAQPGQPQPGTGDGAERAAQPLSATKMPSESAPTPQPPERTYRARVSVPIPGAGSAGYGHYTPPPNAEPPLACVAHGDKPGEQVCVDHPLR